MTEPKKLTIVSVRLVKCPKTHGHISIVICPTCFDWTRTDGKNVWCNYNGEKT